MMSDPTMAEPFRSDPTVAEPFADRGPAPEGTDERDVAARLLGRVPTQAEISEGAAYDDLRAILRDAREDADLSQAAIAGKMELVQSEVSRFETTVGPGTRFGRLCRYLDACGAHLTLTVRTARGRELAWSTAPDRAESKAPPPPVPATVSQPVMAWTPAQTQMLDDILALEECLQQVGLEPAAASRVRHAFLTRLQGRQQVPTLATLYTGVVQPVGAQPADAVDPISATWNSAPFWDGGATLPYLSSWPSPTVAASPSEPPADLGDAPAAAGKSGG